jgi:hypothetical protein
MTPRIPFVFFVLFVVNLTLTSCRSTPQLPSDPADIAYPIIGGIDPVTEKEVPNVRARD